MSVTDSIAEWLKAHRAEFEAFEAATMEDDLNPLPLVEQIAENLAIYAGTVDEAQFIPHAKFLLGAFKSSEGRLPGDYLELENWCSRHAPTGEVQ